MASIPTRRTRHSRNRNGIITFLAIAFALSWLPFLPMLAGKEPAGTFLMPFAPAIAAFVARRWVSREGFRDAGLRPNRRRWPLYVIAVTWPIATTFLSVLLATPSGAAPEGFAVPWGMAAPGMTTLAGWTLMASASALIIFGEEFGWRSYLQLRLFPGRPWWVAAVATGGIWGAWHYPWLLASDILPHHPTITLPLFTLATTFFSIFLGWLRIRTGDVWSASVAHGANNVTEDRWHRLAFTGDAAGTPSLAADGTLLLAEAIVLLGVVGLAERGSTKRQNQPLAIPPASGLARNHQEAA